MLRNSNVSSDQFFNNHLVYSSTRVPIDGWVVSSRGKCPVPPFKVYEPIQNVNSHRFVDLLFDEKEDMDLAIITNDLTLKGGGKAKEDFEASQFLSQDSIEDDNDEGRFVKGRSFLDLSSSSKPFLTKVGPEYYFDDHMILKDGYKFFKRTLSTKKCDYFRWKCKDLYIDGYNSIVMESKSNYVIDNVNPNLRERHIELYAVTLDLSQKTLMNHTLKLQVTETFIKIKKNQDLKKAKAFIALAVLFDEIGDYVIGVPLEDSNGIVIIEK